MFTPSLSQLIYTFPDNLKGALSSSSAKYKALLADIADAQERGQPVLVGTTSIETSEELSELLKKRNIKHNVLNAKKHARESEIVAQAGRDRLVGVRRG